MSQLRSLTFLLFFSLIFGANGRLCANSQQTHLEFAKRARLLDCQPASTKPCFEATLNLVDERGVPVPTALPGAKELLKDLSFTVNGQEVHPFYVTAGSSGSKSVQGRLALVLVDISGSMKRRLSTNETRFEAAKVALNNFVSNFRDGVDAFAIVPFESHGVAATIRSAKFSGSRAQVLSQIADLPLPQSRNNTGLYSAVSNGLSVLDQEKSTLSKTAPGQDFETMLIVMTDGANEVLRGDDPDLLTGESGLHQVAELVKNAQYPVIGIGFGDSGEVDTAALKQISSRFYTANDAEALQKVFTYASKLLDDRILATFLSPWADRASLAGKGVEFQAVLSIPGGSQFISNTASFEPPQMGLPLFEGKATTAELRALVEMRPEHTLDLTVLRPVLVFLGLGTLLFLLWFWVPRLVWPEQYIGHFPPPSRWSLGHTGIRKSIDTRSIAPPGFAHKGSRSGFRNPADPTFVQSRLGPKKIG